MQLPGYLFADTVRSDMLVSNQMLAKSINGRGKRLGAKTSPRFQFRQSLLSLEIYISHLPLCNEGFLLVCLKQSTEYFY